MGLINRVLHESLHTDCGELSNYSHLLARRPGFSEGTRTVEREIKPLKLENKTTTKTTQKEYILLQGTEETLKQFKNSLREIRNR